MSSRACDACRVRRTKCNRQSPCDKCTTSEIGCTYDAKPRRKGPAGRIITAIREEQTARRPVSPRSNESRELEQSSLVPQRSTNLVPRRTLDDLAESYRRFFDLKTNLQGLYDTLNIGIDKYIRLIYPVSPIVSCSSLRERFQNQLHVTDSNFAALVLAISAVSLFAPGSTADDEEAGRTLMKYALCIQSTSRRGLEPSIDSLAASIVLGGLLRTEYGDNSSYVKMRESISLAEIMRLDRPETYAGLADEEREAVLSMFWILAVGEKSFVMMRPSSITLRGRITQLASNIQLGPHSSRLVPITFIFDSLDSALVDCLNGLCGYPTGCSLNQRKIKDVLEKLDSVTFVGLSDVQVVDVVITRIWIRAKIWQTCISHSLLDWQADDHDFHVSYPLTLLTTCWLAISTHPEGSFVGNGKSMGFKLNLIAQTAQSVIDLPFAPASSEGFSADELRGMIVVVSDLANRLMSRRWLRCERTDRVAG